MPTLQELLKKDTTISGLAKDRSEFNEGRDIFTDGGVTVKELTSKKLKASVKNEGMKPKNVTIELAEDGLTSTCECGNDRCKHQVAAALASR